MSSFRSPCALIRHPLKIFGNSLAANGCTLLRDNVGVIKSRRQSPLHIFSHYCPCHLHSDLSKRPSNVLLPMLIDYRLSPNWRLFGRLRSTRTFSVNSVPRVVSGTARLCTSFTDMPFPLKVKAPSLKGLFSSSKKRTKAQGQAAPELQNPVPDR